MLLLQVPSFVSSLLKGFYDPKAFLTHAALLRQAFAHCAKFPAAASRRSLVRVPVPVWLIILSDQLTIAALVGRYPTNKLMVLRPLPSRPKAFSPLPAEGGESFGISQSFLWLSPARGYVT